MRDRTIEGSPLVSILMPAKNVEAYIAECLESVLEQSYDNWELIVVNDNSDDLTKLILQEYALNDSRIAVIDNEGSGIIDALQLAFQNCEGDYITRMDSDDKMAPQKIEKLVNALLKNSAGHVATGYVKYFSENELGNGYKKYESWLNKLTESENNYSEIYKECVIASPCWMTYRDDFIKVGGFDGPYPEDYDLCFRFRNNNLKVIGLKEVLHYWRDYDNRTSRTDSNYADNSFMDLKVHHFIKQDLDSKKELVLWGAGKKGKTIAQKLIDSNIDFMWVCDNVNKIGHNIYGKTLLEFNDSLLSSESQVIVAVAQKGAQEAIALKLLDCESYYFC